MEPKDEPLTFEFSVTGELVPADPNIRVVLVDDPKDETCIIVDEGLDECKTC